MDTTLHKTEQATTHARPAVPGVTSRSGFVRSLRPEYLFLAIALPFGAALAVLTPPFEVPDEDAHFRRSFELSEGRVIARKEGDFTGDELPRSIGALFERFRPIRVRPEEKTSRAAIVDAFDISVDPDDREFVPFSNAAVHSPLAYLPQTLAVFVARRLTSSLLACLYAGRFLNLLAAAAITFIAVRITPIAKWGFTALALTPMSLSLMASLSPDTLTNSLAFLFVALVLECALGPGGRLSGSKLAALVACGVAIGLAKQAYFLLPLSYLLVPQNRAGPRTRYWAGFAFVQGATLAAVCLWGFVVRDIYSPADLSFGMNPREQIHLMFADPIEFVCVLGRTTTHVVFYGEEFLGWLGLVDLRLPVWVYVVELALLVTVFVAGYDPEIGPTAGQALVAGGVALVVWLTVLTVIHITWDKVGSSAVGVQGRYFIPAGPLVGVALSRLGAVRRATASWTFVIVPGLVTVCCPVVLIGTLFRVNDRYFVDSPQAAAQRLAVKGEVLMNTDGREAQARPLFEESLRLDADNEKARLFLGVLLAETRPQQAAEHLRLLLSKKPDDFTALNNLGNIELRLGNHAEAIRLYDEAVRLRPDEQAFRDNLDRARRRQQAVAGAPQQIARALEARAKDGMIEESKVEGQAGWYVKANRGPILRPDGNRLFPRVGVLWRSPPPSGQAIRLFAADGQPATDGRRMPFYACADQTAGPNRVFIFPPPVGVAVLADDDVSWFYQIPMNELAPAERQREDTYRREHDMRFPLTKLPD